MDGNHTRTEAVDGAGLGLRAESVEDEVLGGRVIHYEGGRPEARTVVLIHGIGEGGARDWEAVIPQLADDYHLLALDLPGFGLSDQGNRHYHMDAYVEVLNGLIRRRANGPVVLVGHSMGGAVALRFAGTYPDDVDAVMVASVPGLLNPSSYLEFLRGGHRFVEGDPPGRSLMWLPAEGSVGAFTSRVTRRILRHVPSPGGILDSSSLRQWILRGDPRQIAGLSLAETDFSRTMVDIRAPVSVLWGTEDPIAPLRTAILLASLLEPRDLTMLTGVGHSVMSEAPDAYADWLLARLSASEPRPAPWPRAPDAPGTGQARCEGEKGYYLTGAWDTIDLRGCRDALLDRVSARQINIENSTVHLLDATVGGEDVAYPLLARKSQVMVTAGHIQGDVAMRLGAGHIDVAGTRIVGREEAIRALPGAAAELSFSLTTLKSGHRHFRRHGLFTLEPGQVL